jgi:hypothetical protein
VRVSNCTGCGVTAIVFVRVFVASAFQLLKLEKIDFESFAEGLFTRAMVFASCGIVRHYVTQLGLIRTVVAWCHTPNDAKFMLRVKRLLHTNECLRTLMYAYTQGSNNY